MLKHNLVLAQERMKLQTDRHMFERSFEVGEWVYLKLHTYRQKSINHKTLSKLAPKYYGPFQVLQKIDEVAYKSNLPSNALIHPVFHVSCFKAKLGQQVIPIPTLPDIIAEGIVKPELIEVLQERSHGLRNRTITQVLV